MTENDIREKFEGYVKKGVFKNVARFIGTDVDERMAEGIAQAFEMYRQNALQGVEMAIPVLVVACRRRATDLTRHLVRGQHRLTDALEPRAFHQGRVEVVHLDGLPDDDGDFEGDGDRELGAAIVERASVNPAAMVISTISLGEWVEGLTDDDLALASMRLQGFTLTEIASEVGKSITTVCHRLRLLGEDLARHAQLVVPKRWRNPRRSPANVALAAA